MASGLRYYQRVGTLTTTQQDKLGKRLVDPRNGRVFRYVKLVDATVQPPKGAPLARVGVGVASAWQVAADFSSLNAENFVGINTASTASNGHFFWVMQEGILGADGDSEVYSATIYAYVCTGIVKDDNLRWTGDNSVTGGARVTGASLQAQYSNFYGSAGAAGAASEGSATASVTARAGLLGNNIGQAFGADTASKLTEGFIGVTAIGN